MKRRIIRMAAVAGVAALVFVVTAPAEATHTSACGNHTFQSVLLGCDNRSTRTTQITVPTDGYSGFWVRATGSDSWGIRAEGTDRGVVGIGDGIAATGVYGTGATGVYGTGSTYGVSGKGPYGVVGEGEYGVYGIGSGYGVLGFSVDTGVYASGDNVGVSANSSGTALQVNGKATFSRSGIVTIPAGTSVKTVTLAGVSTASMVLATAQQSASVFVKAAVPGNGSFTIRLTGPAPAGGLKVAYFVLN